MFRQIERARVVRIFLSYDDTRRDVADRLALGLRAAGHSVFFDQDSLPAGTSYDDRIRKAIRGSHLFVFLISRESVTKGAYALTELDIAERRWSHPDGRVLPVLLDDTPIPSLPPYLRAVSVLVPRGDVVGDTLNAVARLAAEHRGRTVRRAATVVVGVLAIASAFTFSRRFLNDAPAEPNGGDGGSPPTADSIVRSDSSTNTPADAPATPVEDEMNPRTWKLKNDRHVRLVGEIVTNGSNVADGIVRDAVEFGAWRYNRCYDAAYGHLAGDMPEGQVVVSFEIRDQLPRAGSLQRSDFADADFNECIVGTLIGQTINAAGSSGAGPVAYSFRFLPN